MRTKHFLAVIAGVALASCVTDKEYVPELQDQQAKITFSSPVMYNSGEDTRAGYYGEIGKHQYSVGGTTYSYPREESFHIFAKRHTNDFAGWNTDNEESAIHNKIASYDGSVDGWAPKKTPTGAANEDLYYYWPSGMKLTFAAYSPADLEQEHWSSATDTVSYGATGLVINDFHVPHNAAKQFDLMFSKRSVNKTRDDMSHSADYYSGVPIEFQHALTSIHFSLKNESSTTVKLLQISLYGVNDTADFNENIVETPDPSKYVIGDNVNPQWTGHTGSVLDTAPYVAFRATDVGSDSDFSNDEGLLFPVEPQYISNLLSQDANAGAGDNHILLVLPQVLTDAAKLRIDYTVNGTLSHKEVNLKDARQKDNSSVAIDEWEIGTSYTYRLVYSAAAASQDKVYFSPTTNGWIDAGVAVIDLAGTTE